MKETLYDIANIISSSQKVFKENNFCGVVARVNGEFDGNNENVWFLINENSHSLYGRNELRSLGRFVPRNSMVAIKILNDELGTSIDYECKNKIKRLEKHHIVVENRSDLQNKTIALLGDKQVYSYTDISLFLSTLQQKADEIAENEKLQREQERKIEELKKQENTAHERGILTKGLNKLQEKYRILTMQQDELSDLTKFIRQQGKLRFNPILDPVQNRIKTRNLFDGKTIVIDGGPGTGKTTTMIQRLKYLTDTYAIKEDEEKEGGLYKLTILQRKELYDAIDSQRDWVFFSPSKLLKEYLADAMNREGLTNTNAKVWHWSDFCKTIIRDNYHLFDPTNENAPFKASRSTETLIYQHSGVIDEFNSYLLNQLRTIKQKFPKIDENAVRYRWTNIAFAIKERFENTDKFNLAQFIFLFNSLEKLYAENCRELLKENKDVVKRIADELCILLEEDLDIKSSVEALLGPVMESSDEPAEDSDIEEDDVSDRMTHAIRQWFKRYCYSLQNKDIRLTPRQESLTTLLLPVLTEEHKSKMVRVGELALFEQYAKYTRGVRSILFGGFAGKYKRFRRLMLTSNNPGWNQVVLRNLVSRRDGKELHSQEQALLVGVINNLVKAILRSSPNEDVNHVFAKAYKELARPIIGIDEATDFCECDIYAMESLLSIGFNSMTICGDMMQRLTDYGITSWNDLDELVLEPTIVEMRTSYRQSTSLLNVAKQLYIDTIGEEPSYKAYMKSNKVPSPLAFISDDEFEKVEWIEKRIKEVYVAYGKKLPSIAIFLNEKNAIPQFVENLIDTDFIADTNIDVVDGSAGNVLASSNQIRVYPIDVVKGMEFDVVFFHNIDNSHENTDLLKRYIYVGVSRAAFFLGVTMSDDDEELSKYFEKNKQWDKI